MPSRIDRDRALPLDLLADQAVFDLELGEIWHRDWVFATPLDAVTEPGDHVPAQIGRQSVLIVRGADLALRAFANVCSHRGAPLVDAPGNAARFSCPYHGWTYESDGRLTSVPYADPDEIDASALSLRELPVAQWHGLVFVSLDPDIEPLEERLSAIEPYVRPLALDRLYHDVAHIHRERWQANWKAIFANALDAYSHFRVHADTVEPVSPTDGCYYLAGSARGTVTGGESVERADHIVVAIPPSFVAIAYPDTLLWQALVPSSVGETTVVVGLASERPVTEGEQAVHLPGWDAAFVDEDRAICELLQRNAEARVEVGPLLQLERAIGDFHDYLAWKLTGQAPSAPTIAAPPGDRPEPLGS